MKKLFLSFCFFALAFLFMPKDMQAQDTIVTNQSEFIPSVIQEITEEYVSYRTFDNQTGPLYKISIGNIIKIKFKNGTEKIFNAQAQRAAEKYAGKKSAPRTDVTSMLPSSSTLEIKGKKVFLNNQRVAKEDIESVLGYDVYHDTYLGACKQKTVANFFFFIGLPLAGAGIAIAASSEEDEYGDMDSNYYTGILLAAAGGTLIDLAIPFGIIGNRRLSWIEDNYNSTHSKRNTYSLNVGMQRHGFGVSLNF